MKHIYLIVLLLFLLPFISLSQESCNAKLKRAQKLFSAGIIEDIESMLTPCLQEGFSGEEKLEAYKLLVAISIFEDKLDKADGYMLRFLKINPEYEIKDGVDPAEFIHVLNTFNRKPLVSVGLTFGGNIAYGKIQKKFSVYDTPDTDIKYSSPGMSIQGGLTMKFHLTDNHNICLDVLFAQQKVNYSSTYFDELVNFNESQTRLLFPLSFAYYKYNLKNLYPFIEGGICVEMLMGANAEITRKNPGSDDITGPSANIKQKRNNYSTDLMAGLGCDYRIKKGRISVTARYFAGLTNQTNKSTRFDNNEFIFKYHYIDSDFRINRFYFTVSYLYPLYNLKKKK